MKTQPLTRNNGSDPNKNDGTGKDVDSTTRSCFINVINNTSAFLTNLTLTHTQGATNNVITVPSLAPNSTSYSTQINYETGFWANFDYWNISFSVAGRTYATPYNDFCNIKASDAGQTVQCIVTAGGSSYNLNVQTPVSDGCNFEITTT